MTKHSPENRAGELYRNGLNPPQPPPELHAPEADLWRTICASLPSDWFTPATQRLLLRYVRLAIYGEELHDALDKEPIGTVRAADLLRQVLAVTSSLGGLAAKMRLSTQVTVTARSTGKMARTAMPIRAIGAEPLGGRAVNGR
jgi:hypothetical protein